MNYIQTLKEIYSYESRGWQLGLDNIRELLKKIGNPHEGINAIHVAGTNGKGSVCAMIAEILQNAGFRVGLYTSPHLIRFNERIRINGKCISDKEIIEYYLKIKKKSKGFFSSATFFEITTAMAFLYFYKKGLDFVVLEVGLGGRLDATNVVKPLVSVITNIGIEHKDFLGETIEQIAYEKAGIIKKNTPIVTGCEGKALEVIKKVSKGKNAQIYFPERIIKNNSSFSIGKYKNLELSLKGDFQIQNASLALTAIEVLKNLYKIKITENSIRQGLANTKWHGRFEFIKEDILVDCAHNPVGILTLVKEIKKLAYRKLILIIGIMKDKDIKSMLDIITPLAEVIILTKARIERAAEPEELAKYVNKKVIITHNIKDALQHAKNLAGKNDRILVTGSIYVVGEAISVIRNSH